MGEHIVDGEFKSDKYDWCPKGFVPLKLTDPMAQPVLYLYALLRDRIDPEFCHDLTYSLDRMGFEASDRGGGQEAWFNAGVSQGSKEEREKFFDQVTAAMEKTGKDERSVVAAFIDRMGGLA